MTQIFSSLQNYQFHHRRLEHLLLCFFLYNSGILITTVTFLDLQINYAILFYTRSPSFLGESVVVVVRLRSWFVSVKVPASR